MQSEVVAIPDIEINLNQNNREKCGNRKNIICECIDQSILSLH